MLKLVLASEHHAQGVHACCRASPVRHSAHRVCQEELTADTLCPFAASSLRACSSCCLAVTVGDWMGAAAALCAAPLFKVCGHACSAASGQAGRAAHAKLWRSCVCASQATSSCTLAQGRSVCTKRGQFFKCTWMLEDLQGLTWPFQGRFWLWASLWVLALCPSCLHPLPSPRLPCPAPFWAEKAWAGEAAPA